jgi:PAS domain S-box-containing protein
MQTATALRETEAKFNALSRQSLYAYAEFDLEGKFVFVNQRGCDILGSPSGEIIGKHFATFLVPDDVQRADDAFQRAQRDTLAGPRQYTVRSKDGSTKRIAVNSIALRKEGRPVSLLCLALDVTEQQEGLDQLRRREEQYRLLADNATDMIWTARISGWEDLVRASTDVDPVRAAEELLRHWHFDYVSPSSTRLLGYDEEEMKAMRLDILLTPESLGSAAQLLTEELAIEHHGTGDLQRQRTIELEHVCKDGTNLWCELTTRFLRDSENRVSGVLGITRNVHKRRQAERTLHQSRKRFRSLVENMPDVVVTTDTQGRIQYINHSPADTPTDEVVGTDGLQCILPEYHKPCRQAIQRAFELQEVQSYEAVDVHGRRWSCRAVPMIAGRTVQSLMVISTDVTEQRRAEERLRESEERFRGLAESLDDVVWTVSLDGPQMQYINPAAERVYGRSCAEFYEDADLWLEVVHPEDRDRVARGAQELLERGWKEQEYRILRPDGEVRWLFDRGRVTRDRDGNPTHIGGLASDITDRRVAEQAILDEHRRLRRLLDMHERDRQLVSYEIHDGLAQPLAAALMQLEASLGDLKSQFPDAALKGCDQTLRLLRESIRQSRQLMGGLRPVVLDEFGVVTAINNLISDSSSDCGPDIEYSHKVQFDRLASPLETAIFRIVQEGLANALQHSRSDRVRVGLIQCDERLRIQVQDWGVGFDPEKVEQNRFGLEGIRERARLFGGQATIESHPGNGASVTVELPLVEAVWAETEESLAPR